MSFIWTQRKFSVKIIHDYDLWEIAKHKVKILIIQALEEECLNLPDFKELQINEPYIKLTGQGNQYYLGNLILHYGLAHEEYYLERKIYIVDFTYSLYIENKD